VLLAAAQITVHVHSGTDPWTVVAAIATVIAAVSALLAAGVSFRGLVYSRSTVDKAGETLREMEAGRAEMEAAHEAELVLQRIAQMQRVRELTIELRELARRAMPPGHEITTGDPIAEDQLPGVAAKLSAVLAALAAIHGSPLDDLAKLAWGAEQKTLTTTQIVGQAEEGIKHVAALFAERDPTIRLDGPNAERIS